MGQNSRRAERRAAASRLLTPGGLALALICFSFGFLAVSCDTPGGFGRAAQGGTTTYSGIDLAVGAPPTVTPMSRQLLDRPDQLGWHLPVLIAALLLMAGAVFGATALRHRRPAVIACTGLGVLFLAGGEIVAYQRLTDLVAGQIARPLPAGREVADYVAVGFGFWAATTLAGVVLAAYVWTWFRHRPDASQGRPPDEKVKVPDGTE
jgi:hypothetical protein